MTETRKDFLKKLAVCGTAVAAFPQWLSARPVRRASVTQGSADDSVRIALIGKGGMGSADTRTALSVPNTKLIAVCDVYDARLAAAKKEWGEDIFTTKDYKDILARNDVDAVIVGTPDHWHQRISIDALGAGKHVYCEKPVIHKIQEGKTLLAAQQKSGKVFQTGSQGMASIGNRKARQLVENGAIGRINLVEAGFTAGPGLLNAFKAPADASEDTIWWRQFLGHAPVIPFNAQKFFNWRNWKDYSTGFSGDLFVHVLASLHFITGADGPERVYGTGGLNYYTDGSRNLPDLLLGYFDYPDKNGLGAFKVSLSANIVDGVSGKWGSMNFKIIGETGTLDVEWDKVTLKTSKDVAADKFASLPPLGKSIDRPVAASARELVFHELGYGSCHFDHFTNFFNSIRTGTPNPGNVTFGVQTAAAALLCLESYHKKAPIKWRPTELKEV
ncbi:MAG: Gfo/Idh/MocA family oxidoreductase [Bacteroidales bacterium]|nr:Gfo/Idh/MocA family oxidoreductase [Bacteroidales bacterium]